MFLRSTLQSAGKFFLLTIMSATVSQISMAQNKQIDSLLSILKTAKEDTAKANMLNALSTKFWETYNYSEAKKYADESLELSLKLDFKKGIADSHHNIGTVYLWQAMFPEALEKYFLALELREELGDKTGMAKTYGGLVNVYIAQGNYPEALKYCLAAFSIQKKAGEKVGMAKSYYDFGRIDFGKGNYPKAMENYLTALNIYNELGEKKRIANSYSAIGWIYYRQSNFPEALKYYLTSLKVYEEIGDKRGIAYAYNDIGNVHSDQGNYVEALKNHQASLKIREEIGDVDRIPISYQNLGWAHFRQGNYPEALKNYLQALSMKEESGDKSGIALIYNDFARLCIKMNRLTDAEKYLDKTLILSKEIGSIYDLMQGYEVLAELDRVRGDFKKAYEHHRMYILYRDSLIKKETDEKMVRYQMQFVFDKKEDSLKYQQDLADTKLKQQVLLTRQQKQAKNYFIAGIGLLLILSWFLYRNYRTRQKLKLQTLRNKIASDLHDDVGSTLSSISIFSEMAKQQSKEVIPMLDTIGESSRKMLDAMADIVWTINPENDLFEKIILRMRSFAYELLGAKNIDFEFVADDEVANMKLPMEVRKNLYLIFKEATNNMVKYSGANRAMFAIKKEKNNLTMMIKDNGRGFDAVHAKLGNGLINMKKRAIEIGGEFTIDSYPGNGTTIQLKVAV